MKIPKKALDEHNFAEEKFDSIEEQVSNIECQIKASNRDLAIYEEIYIKRIARNVLYISISLMVFIYIINAVLVALELPVNDAMINYVLEPIKFIATADVGFLFSKKVMASSGSSD